MTVLDHIKEFLSCRGIVAEEHVYVGFSGGIDSTALLLALRQAGMTVAAVHFQHGIRGAEAEGDAVWCREFCDRLNVSFQCIYLHVPENLRQGETLEEGARRLRMAAWEHMARDGAPVFLAHHGDDALEELFLRMARGANVSGVTGLRAERVIHGVRYLRPMLDFPKAQLKAFLEDNGVTDWRTDSTNLESEYRRNAVRNRLLPLFREIFQTDAGLRRSLEALKQDAECLEDMAEKQLESLSGIEDWQRLPTALLPRVFRRWRLRQDGVDEPPERGFLVELERKLRAFHGMQESIQMSDKMVLRLEKRGLRIAGKTPEVERLEVAWTWRDQKTMVIPGMGTLTATAGQTFAGALAEGYAAEIFRLADMPDTLVVRTWRNGDRMMPFGMSHSRKLQDIFTDAHVPREKRPCWPVLCANGQIIWIPGVKRGEFGRVDIGSPCVTIAFIPQN